MDHNGLNDDRVHLDFFAQDHPHIIHSYVKSDCQPAYKCAHTFPIYILILFVKKNIITERLLPNIEVQIGTHGCANHF
jgi:hypothetical protein